MLFNPFSKKNRVVFTKMKNWKTISSEKDVMALIDNSLHRPQIIFKHSTRCGISAYAESRLIDGSGLLEPKADIHYLDLLAHRGVSDFIAKELGIRHQSPQVIVLKNKKVVYSATHHSIDAALIASYL